MKKIYLTIMTIFGLLILPNIALADGTKVTNFKETIDEEISNFSSSSTYADGIATLESTDLSKYSESDDKINVYLFRGSSCSHCFDAVVYFASIVGDYGKYFNFKTYEVWNNKANANLMSSVAKLMGDDASGVPYIVIGDKTFIGFQDSMATEITNQIVNTYNATDRYDVMDHLNDESTSSKSNSTTVAIIMIAIVVIGGIALIYYVSKSK